MRSTRLDNPIFPRFHIERVPCRLVTTYGGVGTQWLENTDIDRSKLGHQSAGLSDEASGLIRPNGQIQQLRDGDIALLKGERWEGNEGAGLVHRSPAVKVPRLLLTLDFG